MRPLNEMSIQYIKGVGPARKKLFSQLGVETVEDLFYLFPRRYEDRRQMTPIKNLVAGEWYTIKGTVMARGGHRTWFTKKHVFEAAVEDEGAHLTCVWFNQPYLDNYFKPGSRVVLHGKVDTYKNRLQMVAPEYEIIAAQDETLSLGRIVPIYPLTRGMTQRYLRRIMKFCLDHYALQLRDDLPESLRRKHGLPSLSQSIARIHFSDDSTSQELAQKRVAFEEFFFFQVSVILRRLSLTQKPGVVHQIEDAVLEEFRQAFPFKLTRAQSKVIDQIAKDMRAQSPMLRLLQGDVGSGKTVAAFFGCVAAWRNGRQSTIMAPTEILARQHFESLQGLIKPSSLSGLRMGLLVGSAKKEEKEEIYRQVQSGQIDLLIGTHALLEDVVHFQNLSYVVIDEQHKFGVRQRAILSAKGLNPDILIMTATPIPRTLCLTLYGDLDLSVLDEMPPGRGKVTTRMFRQEQEQEVYQMVRRLVAQGQQAYIIYPLIEESEKLQLKAAEKMFERFVEQEFKEFRLALVHGQMNRKQTQATMEQFRNKNIDILVATTVLEVGVDVPDANVMVIEHAERFGLAQLHQLRGRIGRGQAEAVCLVVADPTTSEAQARLKALLSTNDGFRIAEEDLNIRGPGEFFGRHQHGLNELKVANPLTQLDILELARTEALELTRIDPYLHQGHNVIIRQVIQKRYPAYLVNVEAG